MTILTAQQGRNYGRAAYVAVPVQPPLSEVVAASPDLRGQLFPIGNPPEHIEAVKALLCPDGAFSDVMMTFSNNPLFSQELYTLPSRSLDGFTTFHVSCISQAEKNAFCLVDKVLALFPEVIDIEMKPEFKDAITKVFPRLVNNFESYIPFFERHNYMRERLSEPQDQPYRRVQRGFFVDACRYNLSKKGINTFPEGHTVELVRRVTGKIGGMPVEIAVVYANGPQLKQGLYGAVAYTKHERGCPVWETEECDQSRSFVGYLFDPNLFFFGGTRLMPEKAVVLGGDMPGIGGRTDFCLRPIGMRYVSGGWNAIDQDITAFDKHITRQHIAELKTLAKWAFDNSTR